MDEFESSLRVDSPQRRERGDASGGIVAAVRKVVVGERSGGAPFDRRREGRKKTLAEKSGIDVEMGRWISCIFCWFPAEQRSPKSNNLA